MLNVFWLNSLTVMSISLHSKIKEIHFKMNTFLSFSCVSFRFPKWVRLMKVKISLLFFYHNLIQSKIALFFTDVFTVDNCKNDTSLVARECKSSLQIMIFHPDLLLLFLQ